MGRVTLVDTSVWIDYLRSPVGADNEPLRALIRDDMAATTEPIEMELLLGPTNELALRRVLKVIDGTPPVAIRPDLDFRAAAEIYRAVRRTGRTIRNSVDCLIAAIALRHEVPLLHKDSDFTAIAEVTGLDHHDLR